MVRKAVWGNRVTHGLSIARALGREVATSPTRLAKIRLSAYLGTTASQTRSALNRDVQTIAVEPGASGAITATNPDLPIRNFLTPRRFTLEVEWTA
jgi:hypothetical protein